jgi:hypothetical protein
MILFCGLYPHQTLPMFQAHRVGWRHDSVFVKNCIVTARHYLCSKPTVWDGDSPNYYRIINLDMSKFQTVWDGDILVAYNFPNMHVPSPPCGMATKISPHSLCSLLPVPSPPCGMATLVVLSDNPFFYKLLFQAHRVGWRLLVFSLYFYSYDDNRSSKPTVWDAFFLLSF